MLLGTYIHAYQCYLLMLIVNLPLKRLGCNTILDTFVETYEELRIKFDFIDDACFCNLSAQFYTKAPDFCLIQ